MGPSSGLTASHTVLEALLGPVEQPGIQGRESVAGLVPDFLVKPLIPLNACFCFFQVVLGPHCHQLWAFHTPAAQH